MSVKRGGLFGGRPDLLLVDERPPGIQLPRLEVQAALPDLVEDEVDEPSVEIEDPKDEDSYAGDGPLRIFIGSPAAARPVDDVAQPAPIPATLADSRPLWDASALALGAGEDDPEDGLDETDPDRAPVLIRPGRPSAIEPPPLTMSFGGSFSRGSMDAGVMEEEAAAFQEDTAPRVGSVVVHDEIYDRFLRLEDPVEPPPRTLPPRHAGDSSSGDSPSGDSPSGDNGVGANGEDALDALSAGEADDLLAAGEAEDDHYDQVGFSVAAVPREVASGPPPTRAGLAVGVRRGSPVDLPTDHDDDDDDESDALITANPHDELSPPDEDESEGPPIPQVIVAPAPPEPSRLVLGHQRVEEDDSMEIRPDAAHVAAPDDALVLPPPETEEVPHPEPAAEHQPRTTPEWAVRRREARGVVRTGEEVRQEQAAEEESGGGLGLLIFVVVTIGLVVLGWLLLGSRGGESAVPSPAAPTAVQPAEPAPTAPPPGADEPPLDEPSTPPTEPVTVSTAPSDAATIIEPGVDPADLGILRVRATRPARVYIDGNLVGETPMAAVSLSAGPHVVKVVAIDSGRTRTQEVRIDAGRAQELRFNF